MRAKMFTVGTLKTPMGYNVNRGYIKNSNMYQTNYGRGGAVSG